MQTRLLRGSRTVMSLRLCSRAPWTTSSSRLMGPVYPGPSDGNVRSSSAGSTLPRVAARHPRLCCEALDEVAHVTGVRDVFDLQRAGLQGAVTEHAAGQRLLERHDPD